MKTKTLFFLATLLAIGGSLFGQGTPVKNLFGSGVPNANLASVVGTTYVDQSTSPATAYTCTAVTLTPTASQCTWTAGGVASAGTASSTFVISNNSCGSATNCLQWVDDDTTDNCGAATTAFMAAINAYAGPGYVQVTITGSGTGKAYKLATCNLAFTGPSGTQGPIGAPSVHLLATLDCQQSASFANCIQFGPTGQTGYIQNGSHSSHLDGGGTILGCVNVTVACIESEPFSWTSVIQNINFYNTGAGNATLGNCTNFTVQFDSPTAETEISGSTFRGQVLGQCFSNNTDSTVGGGQNTIRFSGNHIANASGTCGSIAHIDGGDHGTITNNSIWGFGIPLRLQTIGSSINGGWQVTDNALDNGGAAGCTAKGLSASIWLGGNGSANAIGPAIIANNDIVGGSGHELNLFAISADSTATLRGITATGNISDLNAANLMPAATACTTYAATFTPCYEAGNQNLTEVAGGGWQLRNQIGGAYGGTQVANVASTPAVLSVAMSMGAHVSCYVALTRAATTSSTLPTCAISWTDGDSSVVETATITPTWAAATTGCAGSTTNTLGNACWGGIDIYPKVGTAINYSTAAYASVGGTTMAYTVLVRVAAQ